MAFIYGDTGIWIFLMRQFITDMNVILLFTHVCTCTLSLSFTVTLYLYIHTGIRIFLMRQFSTDMNVILLFTHVCAVHVCTWTLPLSFTVTLYMYIHAKYITLYVCPHRQFLPEISPHVCFSASLLLSSLFLLSGHAWIVIYFLQHPLLYSMIDWNSEYGTFLHTCTCLFA